MSDKQTRFSFSKNNMAAAAEMQKNEFGQTLLGQTSETGQASGAEVTADPLLGVVARPRSVIDSPELREFLSKHIGAQQKQPPEEPPAPDLGDEAELDEFARSLLDPPEVARDVVAEKEPSNLRRFSASIQPILMANYCPECGFGFSKDEKFCPHCGNRRTSYEVPRQA